jgi:hypothetical protein
MGRHRLLRAVKVCKICGEGYDAFKARDARGRYCSPACLAEARRRHREGLPVDSDVALDVDPFASPDADAPPIGPAALPQVISLGSRKAMVTLDLDATAHPGEAARKLL